MTNNEKVILKYLKAKNKIEGDNFYDLYKISGLNKDEIERASTSLRDDGYLSYIGMKTLEVGLFYKITEKGLDKINFRLTSTHKWLIASILVPFLIFLLSQTCSKDSKSINIENANIKNNLSIVDSNSGAVANGDNSTANYIGEQHNNTVINQSLVLNDAGSKYRFKIANEINLNTPVSYVRQYLGNPSLIYKLGGIKAFIYRYAEFQLRIETIDGESILNLSFLLFDSKTKIHIYSTPITLGKTTFGEICYPDSIKLNRIFSNIGTILTVNQYMAGPGSYNYSNIALTSESKIENIDKYLFNSQIIARDKNGDETINLIHVKNVKFDFVSIARDECDLSEYFAFSY